MRLDSRARPGGGHVQEGLGRWGLSVIDAYTHIYLEMTEAMILRLA